VRDPVPQQKLVEDGKEQGRDELFEFSRPK
jgi:hypothetical protein